MTSYQSYTDMAEEGKGLSHKGYWEREKFYQASEAASHAFDQETDFSTS